METVTGRLIVANLMSEEDVIGAAKELMSDLRTELQTESAKPEKERNTDKIAALIKQIAELGPKMNTVINGAANRIAEQKFYLDRFYNFYALGNSGLPNLQKAE
jgi:hypothetical protein